jgi:hypothetical protein
MHKILVMVMVIVCSGNVWQQKAPTGGALSEIGDMQGADLCQHPTEI